QERPAYAEGAPAMTEPIARVTRSVISDGRTAGLRCAGPGRRPASDHDPWLRRLSARIADVRGVDGGPSAGPRLGRLELRGQPEERGLVAEAGEEAGDPPAEPLDVLHGEQPVSRCDLFAGLPRGPGQRLDLVLARLTADLADPVAQDPRGGAIDHRADSRADLGREARPVRLGDLV